MAYILAIIFSVLMVGLDQLSKYLIDSSMALNQSMPVIDNVINFNYIQNPDGIFGAFENQRWLLISFSSIILAVCLGLLIKKAFKSRMMHWAICLVIAGGVGNMIDRIFRGYVIDFIEIDFLNFYIFNIADCCVVVGVILVLFYFIYDTIRDYRTGNKAGKVEESE